MKNWSWFKYLRKKSSYQERYFLIYYVTIIINEDNNQREPAFGNIQIVDADFPSNKLIKYRAIGVIGNQDDFAIQSIYEFKTKEDYLSFNRK